MALELGDENTEKLNFSRKDVRLTPAATATATAGGTVQGTFLTLTHNQDLNYERTIKSGEGIQFTDGGSKGDFTISGKNASTTVKGIAKFDSNQFNATSGEISIKNASTTVKGIAKFDSNQFNATSGEISIKNASTSNKGIASFDEYAFEIDNGHVYTRSEYVDKVLSIPGASFQKGNMNMGNNWTADLNFGDIHYHGPVISRPRFGVGIQLPDLCWITSITVYGQNNLLDGVRPTFTFARDDIERINGAYSVIKSGSLNTTYSFSPEIPIDNGFFRYFLSVVHPGNSDWLQVTGVRITYETYEARPS